MENVETTRSVAKLIAEHDYDRAMEIRGGNFRNSLDLIKTMVQAQPHEAAPGERRLRIAIMHAGGPAPGMNTAVRVAVRVGLDLGHTMLGVRNGFRGLVEGDFTTFEWMTVSSWVSIGGAELGSSRFLPDESHLDAIEQQITEQKLDGILMVGGFTGYRGAHLLRQAAATRPALSVPIVCVPASINNDLPGSELSVGADTALNSIVRDVDKIKQSAVASQRTFVVEVMGKECGYLALMSGLATGAERVYLPEEGITLRDLQVDVEALTVGFARGKRLGLIIRSEHSDRTYTTSFIKALFEREGGDLFDVREAVLGHVQQGGNPSPFDRIQATRLASHSIRELIDVANRTEPTSLIAGLRHGKVHFTPLDELPHLMDPHVRRPRRQDWLDLRPLAAVMVGLSTP
jgi:6-phosphofructokinase 1